MNPEVSYTGDTPNSLKEALERAEEEKEARRQFLENKFGKAGGQAALLKEEADNHRRRVWGS